MYDKSVLYTKLPFDAATESLQDFFKVSRVLLILSPKHGELSEMLYKLGRYTFLETSDVSATLLSGNTAAHGLGNYIALVLGNQEDWDAVVRSGYLDNFSPEVYAVPAFDRTAVTEQSFLMDLNTDDVYAVPADSLMIVKGSSALLDTAFQHKAFYMADVMRDTVLIAIRGVSEHLDKE